MTRCFEQFDQQGIGGDVNGNGGTAESPGGFAVVAPAGQQFAGQAAPEKDVEPEAVQTAQSFLEGIDFRTLIVSAVITAIVVKILN